MAGSSPAMTIATAFFELLCPAMTISPSVQRLG
jgi:hypothetical protein